MAAFKFSLIVGISGAEWRGSVRKKVAATNQLPFSLNRFQNYEVLFKIWFEKITILMPRKKIILSYNHLIRKQENNALNMFLLIEAASHFTEFNINFLRLVKSPTLWKCWGFNRVFWLLYSLPDSFFCHRLSRITRRLAGMRFAHFHRLTLI